MALEKCPDPSFINGVVHGRLDLRGSWPCNLSLQVAELKFVGSLASSAHSKTGDIKVMEKPRRTSGTPVYKIRNNVALGVVAVCALFGTAYNFSFLSKPLRQACADKFQPTEEEIDRKKLMSIFSPNRAPDIKEKQELQRKYESR